MQFDQASARIRNVDDEPIMAFSLEEMLVDAGFTIAAVVHKIDNALALIESGACDAAIIEANLALPHPRVQAVCLAMRSSSVAQVKTPDRAPYVVEMAM